MFGNRSFNYCDGKKTIKIGNNEECNNLVQTIKKGELKFAKEIEHRERINKCGVCGSVEDLQDCSKCKIRQYCCRDHQRIEWKSHKQFCRQPITDIPKDLVDQEEKSLLSNEEKINLANEYIEEIVHCIGMDTAPSKDIENRYGIQIGESIFVDLDYAGIDYPIGILMFNVWFFVYISFSEVELKNNDGDSSIVRTLWRSSLREALLNGTVPEWLRYNCEKYRSLWETSRFYSKNRFLDELRRRDYKGILWDHKFLSSIKIWPSSDI